MKLSVVIPCKNEAGTVEQLLDSLVAQTSAPDEIVVIDSHSTDTTVKAVKAYDKKLPIKIITAKGRGVTAARNEGAAAASGDMLLFIDADIRLPKKLIATMRRQIANRNLEVGGFPQRMIEGGVGLRAGARLMNSYIHLMSHTKAPIFFCCFFATKKIHETIGGFDPEIWIMEDYDYAYRAKKAGAKFGLIKGMYFIASIRRFKKKAGLSIGRALYAELYRYTHGMRLTKPLFTYEMGGDEKNEKTKKQ